MVEKCWGWSTEKSLSLELVLLSVCDVTGPSHSYALILSFPHLLGVWKELDSVATLENLLKMQTLWLYPQRFLSGRCGVRPEHLHFNNLSSTLGNPGSDRRLLRVLITSESRCPRNENFG